MTTVVKPCGSKTLYVDSKFQGAKDDLVNLLQKSTTLYVGNLSFYTNEEQIYELFSKCGPIRRIIMGLHRQFKTPCGFCFVEYYERRSALDCIKYIDKTKLDNRIIRVDLDYGFCKDRNLGRGKMGGQVRDEYRRHNDEDRTIYRNTFTESTDEFTTSATTQPFYNNDMSYRRKKRYRPRAPVDEDQDFSSKKAHVEENDNEPTPTKHKEEEIPNDEQ